MKNSIILPLFLLMLLSACSEQPVKNEPVAEHAPETFLLEKDKFETTLRLPGELIAFQQVDLYAKVTGFVRELHADIGREVRKGDLLLSLDAPELTSQFHAAESRLKSVEASLTASSATYKRLLETSKTPGTVSQNDLDLAVAKKNADEANLEAARSAIREIGNMRSYLEIRAPFSGIITARNVNMGAYVGPNGKGSEFPLFTLQDQRLLRLAVSVPEAYTSYLDANSEISFKVKSLPADVYKAAIGRMSGALDLRLRAERVEMDIQNADKKLLPGMVAEVSIPLTAKDSTFVVPKSALVSTNEEQFVIAVIDGKTKRVTVRKGRDIQDRTEVFGELYSGERLLVKASEEVKEGVVVR